MDAILYFPMSSRHVSQRAGIEGNAADVEVTLVARLAVDRAFRFAQPERSQIGPLLGSREAVQLGECPAAADLQSAMILLDRLGIGVRRVLPFLGLSDCEECRDRFRQLRLIVLDGQNVIRAPVADRLGNVAVSSHGIDGGDGALEQQGIEQDWNGGEFVGFFGAGFLSQDQLRLRGKDTDQMQGLPPRHLAAPTGLAIDRHYRAFPPSPAAHCAPSGGNHSPRRRDPAGQTVDQTCRGTDAPAELQKPPQPVEPLIGSGFDPDKIIHATHQRTHCYDQHLHQVMLRPSPVTRGSGSPEKVSTNDSRLLEISRFPVSMTRPKKTENYTNQQTVNSPLATH